MLAPLRASLLNSSRSVRAFSSSGPVSDLAKVTLIGRLGADPIKRETSAGKPYYTYSLATSTGAPRQDDAGKPIAPTTNWHTLFAFNESSHTALQRVGKGSTVYVEAELEMRPSEPTADGTPIHDRALLRHRNMTIINRVKPAGEEDTTTAEV